MLLILEDVDYQRTVLDQLRGQVQEVQRKLSLSLIYLEALKQVSNTAADLKPESDAIWKFQCYQLVMDFAMRRCLPPPLNVFAYLWLGTASLVRLARNAISQGRFVQKEQPPLIIMMDAMKGQRLSDRDYHYWRQKALEYSNGITGVNEKTPQKQAERMLLILEDVDYQRTVLDQLRGQVQEVQRKLSLSLIYLEALKQVSSSKNDPTSLSSMQQQQTTLHYISRQSPYPGTKIQRFPVPDKYVPWEVMWLDYEPVAYTRPRAQFPGPEHGATLGLKP
ncbi:protein ced-11-like [Ixodes scapularis]